MGEKVDFMRNRRALLQSLFIRLWILPEFSQILNTFIEYFYLKKHTMHHFFSKRTFSLYSKLGLFFLFILSGNSFAQQMDARVYKKAESFLIKNTTPLVQNIIKSSTWKGDTLQYVRVVKNGTETVIVQPKSFKKSIVSAKENGPIQNSNASISPDGKKVVFIKDYNLWMREIPGGKETQLTFDGIKDFGYATNNAGWTISDQPVLLWSPQSDRLATFQHDGRKVGEMYLVSTKVGHPVLEQWKYPMPGDSTIFMLHRVIINLKPTPEVVRFKMAPDPQRSSITDHIADRAGNLLDVEWSKDGKEFAFLSSSRDHKNAHLQMANPETGDIRSVISETEKTFFESGYSEPSWRVLNDSHEVIWFSQRDNWGHLYLYDLNTGKLKNQITKGDWRVMDLQKVDEKNRKIYFTGAGKEAGDPYYQYLYSVGFDGKNLKLLTPETGTHTLDFSPSGNYFMDTYSTPVNPPVSVLRNMDGKLLTVLEKADISDLEKSGWKPPVQFSVKARDGKTDLYGLMYQPTNLDKTKSYPIVDYIYPGPQTGSVGSRKFSASRGDKQSLAELGFILVEVDALGTPGRSKSFHEFYYGNMGDNGLPDQIAMIRQLAQKNSWMDTTRVGIWGHSGGGFASASAMFSYPDFFKVAVSEAGNHDNRSYEDDWGEKWQGLLVTNPDGTTNYDNQANELIAKNLKGKLLLAHGTMDNNVPPDNTLLVVNALIAANKDFDLLMLPNRKHGFANEPYMMRRRWDYFVKYLMGMEPPAGYEIGK
jgi:dipeptidyl aminopeptidase/acylaminoacyl peptidase